jgi:bifunctional DNA-binding transcriptional regulator/antitoxin component of YhaV-PrlF toxin-antitoxin module
MTVFESKVQGKGLVFLPKEVRASLATTDILLVHAGKAVLIVPRDPDVDQTIESIELIKRELLLYVSASG